jgi:dihydrolipoamide dehydrogenase
MKKGWASFTSANEITVDGPDGKKNIKAKNFIIATGSEPSGFPGITVDEQSIVSSTG